LQKGKTPSADSADIRTSETSPCATTRPPHAPLCPRRRRPGSRPACGSPQAAGNEIRIAHVYSKTGPLEAYGKQTQTGLMMGLDYATGGTMTVAGKKLVVIEKDDQGKPDVGKSLLAAAYGDDKADIAVGPTSSGVALACCRWPRSTRRSCWSSRPWPTPSPATSGTSTSSAPAATAAGRDQQRRGAGQAGTVIATLAQDYAFGRDGVKAFKEALKRPRSCTRNTPTNTTDFTAAPSA
jgi:branched-chain amino acid transport system substrate-binding protein